jgi:hypothetical protein
MRIANKNLLFPEYRDRGILYLCYKMIRYCMFFQLMFYSVMGNYFFLGSMDHLMSRSSICSATNKDSIHIGRCTALGRVIRFNSGSWLIATYVLGVAYTVYLEGVDWDYSSIPDPGHDNFLNAVLFSGPAMFMATLAFLVPVILNPYVLGFPFNPPLCRKRDGSKREKQESFRVHRRTTTNGGKFVDLHTFMGASSPAQELGKEIGRVSNKPDVELGSLATREFGSCCPISMVPTLDQGQNRPITGERRKLKGQPPPRMENASPTAPTRHVEYSRTTTRGDNRPASRGDHDRFTPPHHPNSSAANPHKIHVKLGII